MTQIVVDAGLARQISESRGPITLVDPQGKPLGSVQRPIYSPEEVAEGLRRLSQPGGWLTSEQIKEHIRKLSAK
jgi:hypothetical protein